MANWWNDLGLLKQIYYTIALPSTMILLIQSILSIIGLGDFETDTDGMDGPGLSSLDGTHDFDMDEAGLTDQDTFDGDFRFFTLRGIIAFFTVFGWTGAMLANRMNAFLTTVIALGAGLMAMSIIGYLFYGMTKLQANGNINYNNCIGKSGEVYLTIPPNKQGRGKVMVTVQQRLIEVSAMTNSDVPIKTGSLIIVIDMLSDHTAIVEKA